MNVQLVAQFIEPKDRIARESQNARRLRGVNFPSPLAKKFPAIVVGVKAPAAGGESLRTGPLPA